MRHDGPLAVGGDSVPPITPDELGRPIPPRGRHSPRDRDGAGRNGPGGAI